MELHVSAYSGHRQVSIPLKGGLYIDPLKWYRNLMMATIGRNM